LKLSLSHSAHGLRLFVHRAPSFNRPTKEQTT
jgi:hypothetical protein